MPEVAEWQFARGGALQVFEDPERAGRSSVTFVVDSVDDQIAQLTASGIAIVRTTTASCPDISRRIGSAIAAEEVTNSSDSGRNRCR